MLVSQMVTVAADIANGQTVKLPAFKFKDWNLLIQCLKEAKQTAKSAG